MVFEGVLAPEGARVVNEESFDRGVEEAVRFFRSQMFGLLKSGKCPRTGEETLELLIEATDKALEKLRSDG